MQIATLAVPIRRVGLMSALLLSATVAACQQPSSTTATAPTPTAAVLEATATKPFTVYTSELRTQEVALSLAPGAGFDTETEYMVQMSPGQTLVYSWKAENAPADQFYYELHGQDPADPDKVITTFEKQMGAHGVGAFSVDKAGHYGWFFQNQSEKPVTVKLQIAGFYQPLATPAAR